MEHQRCQNSLTTVHLLDFRHVEACVDSFVWKACAHWPYSLSLSLSLSVSLPLSAAEREDCGKHWEAPTAPQPAGARNLPQQTC